MAQELSEDSPPEFNYETIKLDFTRSGNGAPSLSSQSSSETNTQASVQSDGGGGEVAPRKS
jgi:hypothetical protein